MQTSVLRPVVALLAALGGAQTLLAQEGAKPAPSAEGVAFFERHIRPVLVERCYPCHSKAASKSKGRLLVDTQAGLARGGASGPAIVPGDVEKSRLIQAIRWTDDELTMPPTAKLSPQQIARFEEWVRLGAPDPRVEASAQLATKGLDMDAARRWWAFAPVRQLPPPAPQQAGWSRTRLDAFVLAQMEKQGLAPSPHADARTLLQRVYLDLVGLRPSYEETEAFARDPSDAAYARVVDRLLASPLYGERWGRHWLDVARYGEENPTSEATNRPYPYAWRYRDWVIDACNRDVPYDRFVTLQLAADLIPGTPRTDLVATGFLGIGPVYHKDGRLSKEVIETLYLDDWDERVDVVTRGVLGLTVACARCHDHKFDPITTHDYYALAGVFASTVAVPRPLADVDPAAEALFMASAPRITYLSYLAKLMRSEPGSKPGKARQKVAEFLADLDHIEAEITPLRQPYPTLHDFLVRLDQRPAPYEAGPQNPPTAPAPKPGRGGRGNGAAEPFFHSVFDAGLWVDGSDPDLTLLDIRPGTPRDLAVFIGGNVARPGGPAPRGFPAVLARGDATFKHGSGRRELAERLFTDAGPLAARVIVNRVWGWHFGRPLVDTPSDFGIQGDKPSHPELLDDLAARLIANGWSLKWLHREIVLSAAYQQASRLRPEAARIDPANRWLWRMNPRRLDIEAYRDNLLQAAGTLDLRRGGPSADLDQADNRRRTVYARIGRGRLHPLLQQYGFPAATMHSPGREANTTPLQQLFVLNSPFLQAQAAALAASVAKEPNVDARVQLLYRKVLARDPDERERELARAYLADATLTDYAQALLATNEVIYWP